ncbi:MULTISPECIES: ACP S-malonyltransferase [unclassified Haematospirillum]|uniref:ACP S-malonyltransferase n=1 Tax=unclassified Haematospirillum TaxID=2622088 RepID=UPI00143B2F12|nr:MULTISPECIES: ACP S-malonyltransferase [unclassified Haematospirillum]NKD54850.1 ACP S-malonyltransferase [Haematospirillum sp. H4890]NKD74688.1 ACP S-malonyltransferase [Haematospirillum sp. H4485]
MLRAFVFPGQGSQAVGMGCALGDAFPVARAVYQEVDDALGQNLSALMADGPGDALTLTENAQPALMAVSMAVVRILESRGLDLATAASFVAGHSLGEYAALCAAGALSITDTARLLRIRGRAMQQAVPVGEGAMAALLGLDLEEARAIAAEAARDGGVCQAANDNAPGQVVISGSRAAVERAIAIAVGRGARRPVMLPVSAPFHCALMQPAADAMAEALASVAIAPPVVPVVANVTAAAVQDPDTIRRLLVEQVTGSVRWRESVLYMKEQGVTDLVECGAGKVLTGLARRIDRDMSAQALNTPEDIDAFFTTSFA